MQEITAVETPKGWILKFDDMRLGADALLCSYILHELTDDYKAVNVNR